MFVTPLHIDYSRMHQLLLSMNPSPHARLGSWRDRPLAGENGGTWSQILILPGLCEGMLVAACQLLVHVLCVALST